MHPKWAKGQPLPELTTEIHVWMCAGMLVFMSFEGGLLCSMLVLLSSGRGPCYLHARLEGDLEGCVTLWVDVSPKLRGQQKEKNRKKEREDAWVCIRMRYSSEACKLKILWFYGHFCSRDWKLHLIATEGTWGSEKEKLSTKTHMRLKCQQQWPLGEEHQSWHHAHIDKGERKVVSD